MPAEDTKDAGLIRRAIRERWPIPEEKRSALIARAIQIAEHSDKEKAVIGAVRAVLEADKINLEQEKRDLQIPERTINEHYIRFIEVGGGDKVPEISGTAEGGLSNGPSRS